MKTSEGLFLDRVLHPGCDGGEADSGVKLREVLSREGEIEEPNDMRRWEVRTEEAET